MFVQPEETIISNFCRSLTGITSANVVQAQTLAEVLPVLQKKLLLKDRVFASYGDCDRIKFQKECERKNSACPFGSRHINIKTLLALTENWPKEVGMAEALDLLGIPLHGTHHNAKDDAYNITELLAYILSHNVAVRSLRV